MLKINRTLVKQNSLLKVPNQNQLENSMSKVSLMQKVNVLPQTLALTFDEICDFDVGSFYLTAD